MIVQTKRTRSVLTALQELLPPEEFPLVWLWGPSLAYHRYSDLGHHLTHGHEPIKDHPVLDEETFLSSVKLLMAAPDVAIPRVSTHFLDLAEANQFLKSLDPTGVRWRDGTPASGHNMTGHALADVWIEFGFHGRPELSLTNDDQEPETGQAVVTKDEFLTTLTATMKEVQHALQPSPTP